MRGDTFWCHTRCFRTGIVKHSSNKALCQHITGVIADRTPQNIKACPHTSPISTAQRLALCWYSPSGLLVRRAQGAPLRMWGRCLGTDSMVKGWLTPYGHGTKQVNLWSGIHTRWKMNMLALARFIDVPHQERAGSPRLFAQLPGSGARSNTSVYYGALLKKCWYKDK